MICVLMYVTSNMGSLGINEIIFKGQKYQCLRGDDAKEHHDQCHFSM